MSAPPGGDPTPLGELIGLASEPIAVFDAERQFRAANPAFQKLFRAVGAFLTPATSWDILISEAARHDLLTPEVLRDLTLTEDRLMERPDTHPEIVGAIDGAGTYRFRLRLISGGGLAMTLTPSLADAQSSERELEQLMAKVLEACPTCLTMARIGDGQILYRSPSATELLGKGLNSVEHFAKREERADFITALLPNARVDDMRITARRADGSTFPASISAQLIDYRGEDVIVSSIDDLSEELAIQDELSRQKERIFQSEKMSALGELLAGVAHELNNPLSIVIGNAQILLEEETDAATTRRIVKLTDAAERCVGIVKTFLSLARERPLDIAEVPVERLIDKAEEAFRAGGGAGALGLERDIAAGLPPLRVDEVQIVQVLSNLMVNAEHAIAESGRAGHMEISVRRGPPGRVHIRFVDDGPGIPDEIAGRIFDPLFTTKSVGKGTGIGLALCHRIVTAHGGTIALDRAQRAGACFVLELPATD